MRFATRGEHSRKKCDCVGNNVRAGWTRWGGSRAEQGATLARDGRGTCGRRQLRRAHRKHTHCSVKLTSERKGQLCMHSRAEHLVEKAGPGNRASTSIDALARACAERWSRAGPHCTNFRYESPARGGQGSRPRQVCGKRDGLRCGNLETTAVLATLGGVRGPEPA